MYLRLFLEEKRGMRKKISVIHSFFHLLLLNLSLHEWQELENPPPWYSNEIEYEEKLVIREYK
jgi:hypothetical protein